jgi:hypothetical protein
MLPDVKRFKMRVTKMQNKVTMTEFQILSGVGGKFSALLARSRRDCSDVPLCRKLRSVWACIFCCIARARE